MAYTAILSHVFVQVEAFAWKVYPMLWETLYIGLNHSTPLIHLKMKDELTLYNDKYKNTPVLYAHLLK